MQTDAATTPWSYIGIYAGLIVAAVLAILLLWIWLKGRRLSGENVFRASRLSRGNRIFPSQVVISTTSITLYKPQWIGKLEESIHLAHVASIRIDTHLVFSDVFIESTSGQDPIACHGHTKGDAVKMKALIEGFQSGYYKTKT